MLNNITFLLSTVNPETLAPCAAEITFVGRSNVGKSTLINALCRKDVARVSGTPGRTRAINVFTAAPDRWLVDLPGYGFARGPAAESAGWGPMIEKYLTGRPSLRMVFTLIDAEVGPTKLDLQMQKWLVSRGLPWRAVATKADQVKPSRALVRRREVAQALGISTEALAWVSAAKGVGIRELRDEANALLKEY